MLETMRKIHDMAIAGILALSFVTVVPAMFYILYVLWQDIRDRKI